MQRTQGFGVRPGGLIGEPVLDDAGAELGAQVDRQVGHSERMRERAGAADGLGGAAREIAVVVGVRPQLERHRDGLLAALGDQQGCDGAVDAAAHRDERAPVSGCEPRCRRAGDAAERAVQGVGGELGGVALGGDEPAELLGDLVGADARGVEQRGVAQQRDDRAAGCDRGAAAAGVEAGVGDRAVRAVGV